MSISDNKQMVGWIQAFVAVLVFLGINTVAGRFGAVVLQVNPVIYSCAAFGSCALVLLLIGGKGPLARETMRSIDTWVYGCILMMSYIIGMILFSYVTSTEGTMLQKVSVLIGLLGSWFFLGRNPDRYQVIGTIVITAGVIMVALGIDEMKRGPVYIIAFLYGALQVARIFAAELHRPHARAAEKSDDPKAKARVVGFVMFVISILFLVITFFVALAQEQQGEPFVKGLPMIKDFSHPETIFAGFIVGILIVAPSRILEFASSYTIKAENFTTVTALSFIATVSWEFMTSPLTGLSMKEISQLDILAGVLITLGGLFIALTRRIKKSESEIFKKYLAYLAQEPAAIEDSRDIVANTLEHFDNDIKKSADALDLPTSVIQALIDDEDKVLGFKTDIMKQVARRYRKKVAAADPLTGLSNRSAFVTEIRAVMYESNVFSILYIDLDKFKPVNDTHGHEIGDAVLKDVAERLRGISPKGSIITRMGGDEFCVLLVKTSEKEAKVVSKALKKELAKPFEYENVDAKIKIGASIGIATYPDHGDTVEILIAHADKGMYGVKHSNVE